MKTLLLVRHAESGWDHPELPDHERPLNDRGRRDASAMGLRLKSSGVRPDAILTSTAVRARTTAAAMADALAFDADRVVERRGLYGASCRALLQSVQSLDDRLVCVMLVGHNPGLSELARQFSDEMGQMPPCAVAAFDFDLSAWSQVGDVGSQSQRFDYPGAVSG